ncbi:hypothetical protein MJN51_38645, partial [Salmonella enterica subsp. enterica serovar Kentucky]|nr:hypothetical protein [Salmonella enterica subsp. enterica serovar Kentucky]
FSNEKLFYVHAFLGYVLKRRGYDALIKYIRSKKGGTPRLGIYATAPPPGSPKKIPARRCCYVPKSAPKDVTSSLPAIW